MFASRLIDTLLLGALCCSIGLNVVQTQRIRALSAPPAEALERGIEAPPLAVKTLDGNETELRAGAQPLILYFFSESCHWCERNAGHVRSLESQARGRYRLAGVSLTEKDVRGYAVRHGFTFPVYAASNPAALEPYKIRGTPQTVVISPDGRIVASWTGAYTGKTRESIEKTLAIRLGA
jgi:peroxiredoxin